MIQLYDAHIQECIVHWVGNKTNDEGMRLSKEPLTMNEVTMKALSNYFYKPFVAKEYFYSFYHQTNIDLNTMYSYIKEIFTDNNSFCEVSSDIEVI